MSSRKPKKETITKPAFDPKNTYRWQSDAQFSITGLELDLFYKAMSAAVATPDAQRILLLADGFRTVQNIVKEGYEQDIIHLVAPDEKPLDPPPTS